MTSSIHVMSRDTLWRCFCVGGVSGVVSVCTYLDMFVLLLFVQVSETFVQVRPYFSALFFLELISLRVCVHV